jgi:MFS family permease
MGIGAALTMPATLSIINDVFRDPDERARAIGAWAASAGLGIAIGPIAGGLLLRGFWWGSVFLVNVPVVLVGLIGAIALVPDSKNPLAQPPDPVGAFGSVLGLGLLLWTIIEAPAKGWASREVVVVGLSSLLVLGAFVVWESQSSHPMLKLDFFRERRFSFAALGESLGIFGLFGALFVLTQFLQFDLGYSPLEAGLRILPIAGILVVVAAVSPLIVRRIGVKLTIAAGLTAIAGGLWQISAASSVNASYMHVLPGLLLVGLGAGLLMPTATNSVVGSVPQGDAGVGSATNVVAIQVGGALGVAVIGSVLATRYQEHLRAVLMARRVPTSALTEILGSLGGALAVAANVGGATGAALASAGRSAFMSGVSIALLVGAVVALVGTLIVLARLPSRTRDGSSHVVRDPKDRAEPDRYGRRLARRQDAVLPTPAGETDEDDAPA